MVNRRKVITPSLAGSILRQSDLAASENGGRYRLARLSSTAGRRAPTTPSDRRIAKRRRSADTEAARHEVTGMAVSRSRRARAAQRRRRRMERVDHDLTAEQWTALQATWGGCADCSAADRPLQRDCVLAISRGGRYTLDNVVPVCGSCNASKSNDEVTTWLRRRRLDERWQFWRCCL